MSLVLISPELRQGLQAAFAAMFNVEAAAACRELGIPPIAFNWERAAKLPKTCFVGNRSFEDLRDFEGADFPAVSWWMGSGQDLNTESPRRFSGIISAGWRFFCAVPGRSSRGLTEQREAVEAAMGALVVSVNLDHGAYRKDLVWGDPVDYKWLDQDSKHVGWVQEIQFNASFEVNV